MKPRIIITGDDLGLSVENNAGIIEAYRHEVLSCTCLMVGGDAVEEAIDLAKQHPGLAVGLHVAFSDTKPISPPEEVPLLVQSDGQFPADDRAVLSAMFSRKGRRQIKTEIAAQFRAYHATGLEFDHVNGHRHIHRHPLIAHMLFSEAAHWNVKSTRIPWDPPTDPLRYMRAVLLWRLGSYYGLHAPDRSIGRDWTPQTLVEFLLTLRAGKVELYFHPVTTPEHRYASDLPILLDAKVKAAMGGLMKSGYRGV